MTAVRGPDPTPRVDPLARLLADAADAGGGTYEQGTYLPFKPERGYAVAVGGVRTTVALADLAWLRRWAPRVTQEHGTPYVGTWVDDGLFYLDAVTYTTSYRYAMRLARIHRQLAIYDFATGRSLETEQEVTE